jgi:hypothetical protein
MKNTQSVKNTNQSVMNNKNQSTMSNEQSLFMYLTEQMNDKVKSLGSSEFNDIDIYVDNSGKMVTDSDNVFVKNTLFQIHWISQQLSVLNEEYGQYNETIKSLVMRDYLGNPKKYEIRSEGPSEGDIECIIEGLIEDKELEGEFQYLLERTLTIFDIKK